MLKRTFITLLLIMTLTLNSQTSVENSIHQFKVADIYGNIFDFSQLKGKKVMIVNTASKCGLTYQYEALQNLYSQFKDLNFVIIGFPSNDFLWQEPGSNDEIIEFCEQNYGVTFPMMSKVTVKGTKIHPIYQFLTQKSKNNYRDSRVTWNFQKYLINQDGRIEKIISPRTRPDSEEIVSWITDVD
ncbi:MAG: glutathione peroxidase [Flavobacteriaceae bacterium]|nr:glutathione peroxidase [Flavobacteriaceae bacterium]MBL6678207.1 glutathione peroxidase [Flavobacteriaceae bacterium]